MIHRTLEDLIRPLLGDKKANTRIPESFAKAYPEATFSVITPKNVDEFL